MTEAAGPKLTKKQDAFVKEYLSNGCNATAAYMAAYDTTGAASTAAESACRLLKHPAVAAVVAAAEALADAERAAVLQEYAMTEKEVLSRWVTIATANPNDLIQHCRAPCRYCHGVDHAYQWKTQREFREAVQEAVDDGKQPPTDEGGYGYRTTAAINPECPECSGLGVGYVHAADTRTLSGAAQMLYAGTKQTRDVLEIKMADQAKALENVARHLGMFVDRSQTLGKDGKPVDPAGIVMLMDFGDGKGPRTVADIAKDRGLG